MLTRRKTTERPAGLFLPATREEMAARGWDVADVVLVTGDAYVDHPSFGVALIGRWLEAHGYRVVVLPQPRHDNAEDFKRFGRPRLFFGITAGNLDSIVANYTGNAKVRDKDDYSADGDPYFGKTVSKSQRRRPDRATIRYANLARSAFPDVPVILGGLEASLRRFAHYDYQQQKIRASILTDAKADLAVYGMGERAVLEVAGRLADGRDLTGIAGTCERLTEGQLRKRALTPPPLVLPSFEEVKREPALFLEAELLVDTHARALARQAIVQKQQATWVLQHRPAEPLRVEELDRLYALPFARAPHPLAGDVPACRMIRDSVTIVRGCCGNCSFCAIARHQGPVVTSRSRESVLAEVKSIARRPDFKGTISDLGGPTANLYGVACASPGPCKRHDCLYPRVCKHLRVDEEAFLGLLREVESLEGVRHAFVSSGLRMELLLQTPRLLERIVRRHTPGAIKIAPEHTEPEVLRLMHKPGSEVLERFLAVCRDMERKSGREIHLTPYLMSAHPGCTARHMENMAQTLGKFGLSVRRFQDFTPTPGTISTAMFVSGLDRDGKKAIPVARKAGERLVQRRILEGLRPEARKRRGKKREKRGSEG